MDANPLATLKSSSWYQDQSRRFEKALRLLPACVLDAGSRWADLGCGDGIFTATLYALTGPDVEIMAVDHNARTLERFQENLRRLYPAANIRPIRSDFTRPLDLAALDGLIIANAFHFVPDPGKSTALATWLQSLKSGGRAVVIEYNTSRKNPAVPYPIPDSAFLKLAAQAGFIKARIAVKTPSTFLGEMYAGLAFAP